MNYGKLNDHDIANGTGIRVSLFVSGCNRHCPGCFNLEAQDFEYGKELNNIVINDILELMDKPWIDGLTILGGEPFEDENIPDVAKLVMAVRARFCKDKTIWIYSGYTLEELLIRRRDIKAIDYILHTIDVLVDGPFVDDLRDISLEFRGSSNQRIIDVPASLNGGYIIEKEIKR